MFEFKSTTKCFSYRQNTIVYKISILLWQHVSVLLDHLQASIQKYDVQSVHDMR